MSWYDTKRWHRKREHILKLDGYKDQIARRFGRTEEAVVVHHIYPRKDFPQYAWSDWNLISVSRATHKRLENFDGGLTEEGMELMRRTEPGKDWRKNRVRFI